MATTTDFNRDQIARYLTVKGLTRAQVAGVIGNLQIESGLSTTAYNKGENAIGLAQWEGGRRTRLQQYAAAHGGKETDLGIQLGFLWQELTGSEKSAGDRLRTASTPQQAAAIFDQYYERSSGAARAARQKSAAQFYKTWGGTGPNAPVPFPGTNAAPGSGTAQPVDDDGSHGPPVYSESPYDKGTVGGQILGTIATPIIRFATIGLAVTGGVALVVVGLAHAIQPVTKKVAQTVETVAKNAPIPI